MVGLIIAIVVVVVLAVAVVVWAISTSNRFKVLLVKIKEADSGIDVALTKRYDTLTKTIEVVKGYAKHETELFAQVINLRAGMSTMEKSAASQGMDDLTKKINVVAEAYPELRSSDNYKQLQEAIADAEDHLQAARRVFNMNVSSFNQSIVVFPASIIANGAHYAARDFFMADEAKRADVKIDL